MKLSTLAQGNLALRNKDYETAIRHYTRAQIANPDLAHMLRKNLELAYRRLGVQQPVEDGQKVFSVDVVVPVYNALEDVKKCLVSLQRCTDQMDVKVIVVNDGSDEPTTQWLREYCSAKPIFKLIEHPKNVGYTMAVNTGLKTSTASYTITQNSDTIVAPGWLTGLIRCMNASPEIGIVGPLSNAASWQNVPSLRDEQGAFAVNDLPPGHTVEDMARVVQQASAKTYPRLPFVNGFCFMIKREVIDAIGYMDEENFPVGYGEENDYCIRAIDAGFELAIADDVYVFHAKSKSFGHDRRKELSKNGSESLKRKHTPEKYFARVDAVKKTEALDEIRARIQQTLQALKQNAQSIDLMNMRVLFLLPVKGGGGGAHSVVQEVTEMRRLGLTVHVGVKHEQVTGFLHSYEDIPNAAELFVGFDDDSLIQIAESYDVVVGTIFSSMELVKRIVEVNSHILPAYYVQDYEPMFFEKGTEKWQQAHDSYTLVQGAFLFAKTQWIIQQVQQAHGVTVHKVAPSIDHEVYKPRPRSKDGRVHLAAMIRPQTPRRGAERTMRVLSRLHKAHQGRLAIHLFGCAEESKEFQALQRDFPYTNHGPLKRPEVASLLGNSDLFLDLSDYQAFGRTALEAMACACAAVVPLHGGADEYAVHQDNALVVDSLDEEKCFAAIHEALAIPEQLQQLQHKGLLTASRYSVHSAAVSECLPLAQALSGHRAHFPKQNKPTLALIPSRRGDGLPAGSGYVRVVLPYQTVAVRKHWRVRLEHDLPTPGSADAVLIQHDAAAFSLEQLRIWCASWKQANGKLIYEIDDDLLDASGMKHRGYKGDIQALAEKVHFLATAADVVTASTEELAQKLRQLNARVHVIPNCLDSDLWQLDKPRDHHSGPFGRDPNGPIRIGYIGTPTHDADLDLITPAMQAIQKKYGNRVEIEVIGGFQNKTPTFGKRVGLPKKNDYPNFVKWLQQRVHWDIGIIPLVDDAFNRSKSNLKFLEYAALDMAIVVSNTESYSSISENGTNCLVVSQGSEEWLHKISTLIDDAEMRAQTASNARLQSQKYYTLRNNTKEILSILDLLSAHFGKRGCNV